MKFNLSGLNGTEREASNRLSLTLGKVMTILRAFNSLAHHLKEVGRGWGGEEWT